MEISNKFIRKRYLVNYNVSKYFHHFIIIIEYLTEHYYIKNNSPKCGKSRDLTTSTIIRELCQVAKLENTLITNWIESKFDRRDCIVQIIDNIICQYGIVNFI